MHISACQPLSASPWIEVAYISLFRLTGLHLPIFPFYSSGYNLTGLPFCPMNVTALPLQGLGMCWPPLCASFSLIDITPLDSGFIAILPQKSLAHHSPSQDISDTFNFSLWYLSQLQLFNLFKSVHSDFKDHKGKISLPDSQC